MPSASAMSYRCWRASIASRVVAMVLRRWLGIWRMNCSSQEYLCQLKRGLSSSGALLRPSQRRPLSTVAALFQTSALLADSWPPLA